MQCAAWLSILYLFGIKGVARPLLLFIIQHIKGIQGSWWSGARRCRSGSWSCLYHVFFGCEHKEAQTAATSVAKGGWVIPSYCLCWPGFKLHKHTGASVPWAETRMKILLSFQTRRTKASIGTNHVMLEGSWLNKTSKVRIHFGEGKSELAIFRWVPLDLSPQDIYMKTTFMDT